MTRVAGAWRRVVLRRRWSRIEDIRRGRSLWNLFVESRWVGEVSKITPVGIGIGIGGGVGVGGGGGVEIERFVKLCVDEDWGREAEAEAEARGGGLRR